MIPLNIPLTTWDLLNEEQSKMVSGLKSSSRYPFSVISQIAIKGGPFLRLQEVARLFLITHLRRIWCCYSFLQIVQHREFENREKEKRFAHFHHIWSRLESRFFVSHQLLPLLLHHYLPSVSSFFSPPISIHCHLQVITCS